MTTATAFVLLIPALLLSWFARSVIRHRATMRQLERASHAHKGFWGETK